MLETLKWNNFYNRFMYAHATVHKMIKLKQDPATGVSILDDPEMRLMSIWVSPGQAFYNNIPWDFHVSGDRIKREEYKINTPTGAIRIDYLQIHDPVTNTYASANYEMTELGFCY